MSSQEGAACRGSNNIVKYQEIFLASVNSFVNIFFYLVKHTQQNHLPGRRQEGLCGAFAGHAPDGPKEKDYSKTNPGPSIHNQELPQSEQRLSVWVSMSV